ncbi:TonB-dependent receptor [soil metagenome]
MFQKKILAAALTAAFFTPFAVAADDKELAQIREQVREMKQTYEARIQALETRLLQAETNARKAERATAEAATAAPDASSTAPTSTSSALASNVAPSVSAAPASPRSFNPSIALTLGGTYSNLSRDPKQYRLQGFIPAGEDAGPGKRSFNLGESELTFSANIDHRFSGQLTFALTPENTVSVEEAFVRTQGLSNGLNLKAGRFLSAIGYLNNQHAHAWDFVDAPLAYQAFLGGQYKPDGLQMTWLAPTERFLEIGLEAGSGASFPGNDRNRNGFGSTAVFAHVGDDVGESASWRAGLSYLKTGATDRRFADADSSGAGVTNAFSGNSSTWIVDGIVKWAPGGNASQTSFKLQGEYFRRRENGTLSYDTQAQSFGTSTGGYASAQSGWYLQAVYQFMPAWRTGLRYDKLYSGTTGIGLVGNGALTSTDFASLASYNPSRSSLMLDYSPSEFSRVRLQLARDLSRPGVIDNQLFLQYIMSLGAHGAHTF